LNINNGNNLLLNIRDEILKKYGNQTYLNLNIIAIIRNTNGKFELKKIFRVDNKNKNYMMDITNHYN
jgi:hypothetical protein